MTCVLLGKCQPGFTLFYFNLFIYPVKSLQDGDLAMTATQKVEDKTIQNKETAKMKCKKTGNSTKTAKII